ncbi:MAG: prolyl oligopeptidase family serine peptidase [bacterium]
MKRVFVLNLIFLVALCGTSFAQNKEIYEKHKSDFDYDRSQPLNAEVKVLDEQSYYTKYHVSYDSVNGERVPGFLYIPKNLKAYKESLDDKKLPAFEKKSIKIDGPPWPTIFIMHFLQSDKTFVEPIAPEWATYGYAVFAIDGVLKGERAESGKNILDYDPKATVANIRQQVIDIRRGADFLATRDDIDFFRLGFLGVSMGAITGTIACGVDGRFRVIVLADGAASLRSVYENKSTMKEIQVEVEKAAKKLEELGYTFEEALEIFEPIDPVHYAPYLSPRPVLMINGTKDELFPKEAMEALHAAVGEPKKVQWFNSGHILPIPNVLHLTQKWFKHFLSQIDSD